METEFLSYQRTAQFLAQEFPPTQVLPGNILQKGFWRNFPLCALGGGML
jgi:hypothetical protein